jgi:hypothetical protein
LVQKLNEGRCHRLSEGSGLHFIGESDLEQEPSANMSL